MKTAAEVALRDEAGDPGIDGGPIGRTTLNSRLVKNDLESTVVRDKNSRKLELLAGTVAEQHWGILL